MGKRHTVGLAAVSLLFLSGIGQATTLSTNLSSPASGTETAGAQTWLAASFGTDTSRYALSAMTLIMSGASNGGVTLSLYSDNLSQPGQLLATLNEVPALSSTLAPVTFEQGGYVLSANTTYWAVLEATSGSAEWGFTDSNAGSGVGFQHTWGISDDAGRRLDHVRLISDVAGRYRNS